MPEPVRTFWRRRSVKTATGVSWCSRPSSSAPATAATPPSHVTSSDHGARLVAHGELQGVRWHLLLDALQAGERLQRGLRSAVRQLPEVVPGGDASPSASEVVRAGELVGRQEPEALDRVEDGEPVRAGKLRDGLGERPVERRDPEPVDRRRAHPVVELAQADTVTVLPARRLVEGDLGSEPVRQTLHAVQHQGAGADGDGVRAVGEQSEERCATSSVVEARHGRRPDLVDVHRGAAPLSPVDEPADRASRQSCRTGLRGRDQLCLPGRDPEELGGDGGSCVHDAISAGRVPPPQPRRRGLWTTPHAAHPVVGVDQAIHDGRAGGPGSSRRRDEPRPPARAGRGAEGWRGRGVRIAGPG